MTGQMSIFDFLKPKSLDSYTEEEMVREVSEATGINFRYKDDLWGWVFEKGKARYNIRFSNYNMIDRTDRFISCGWMERTRGSGSPCDSIEEAVNFFRRVKERVKNG